MKPLRSALLYAVLGLLVTAAHTQPIVRLLGAPVGYWGVMLAYWALASALGGMCTTAGDRRPIRCDGALDLNTP